MDSSRFVLERSCRYVKLGFIEVEARLWIIHNEGLYAIPVLGH